MFAMSIAELGANVSCIGLQAGVEHRLQQR